MDYWYEFEKFTIGKRTFRADTHYDDGNRAPWEDDCIYENVVSDWTHRDPEPHERILHSDGSERRLFDGRQYIKIAVEEGGCTKSQAAEQLEQSFEHIKDWCEDRWHYVGVRVRQIDADGEDIEPPHCVNDSVWGIEDCDTEHIREMAHEIAEEIIGALEDEAKERRAKARALRARAVIEKIERAYWAARGMVTA